MKGRVLVIAALMALLPLTGSVASAAGPNAVITNAGCQGTNLPANDDGSSPAVPLPFTINFFENNFNQLWVNNNGNVTFDSALATFTPFGLLGTSRVIIAPFFADVDTRGAGSGTTHYGNISAGATEIGGHQAFCVNWIGVGYFNSHTDKLNSFQLVLIDRSDVAAGNFDIMFNYDQVQWETGDASGGVGGLGGSPARAGFSNGTSASFEIAGSGTPGSFLDSNPISGLIHNNIGSPLQDGRYIFPVRNGAATGHSISGHIWANTVGTPAGGAFVSACPTPFDTPCRLGSSAADGSYSINNLPDHTSGGTAVDHDWSLTVNPPGGSGLSGGTHGPIPVNGSDVPGQDVILHGPTPLPPGASIFTPGRGTQTSGTPNVYWGDPITIHVPGCTPATGTNTATLLVEDGYSETVTLVEGPPGTYSGTFAAPFPHHGNAHISWSLGCGGSGSFDIYIDPSGVVTAVGGAVVSGATMTLFRSDDPAGPFIQVPNGSPIMSPGNQANPDTTTATGNFGWDVLPGFYKVRAEKLGCTAPGTGAAFVETGVLTIPPPVTDLELVLDCGPTGTTINALSDTHEWIGLKNSDDQGTKFDLRAELLKNNSVVATGTQYCVSGVTRNPALAKEAIVPWSAFSPVPVGSNDVLAVRLSARIGTTNPSGGPACSGHGSAAGLRFYYDAASRNSHLDVTVGANSSVNEYFHSDGLACNNAVNAGVNNSINSTAPGVGPAKCKDAGVLKLAGGNLWQTISTWSLALP